MGNVPEPETRKDTQALKPTLKRLAIRWQLATPYNYEALDTLSKCYRQVKDVSVLRKLYVLDRDLVLFEHDTRKTIYYWFGQLRELLNNPSVAQHFLSAWAKVRSDIGWETLIPLIRRCRQSTDPSARRDLEKALRYRGVPVRRSHNSLLINSIYLNDYLGGQILSILAEHGPIPRIGYVLTAQTFNRWFEVVNILDRVPDWAIIERLMPSTATGDD